MRTCGADRMLPDTSAPRRDPSALASWATVMTNCRGVAACPATADAHATSASAERVNRDDPGYRAVFIRTSCSCEACTLRAISLSSIVLRDENNNARYGRRRARPGRL